MSEWFENEDFWREMYPSMFPEERLEAAEAEVEKILSLVEFSGTHILDLCCGPARPTLHDPSRARIFRNGR